MSSASFPPHDPQFSASLLRQLEEEPELFWVWRLPGGAMLATSDYRDVYRDVARSARGIYSMARRWFGAVTANDGLPIEDGWPEQVTVQEALAWKYYPIAGFVLHGEDGEEIRRWEVR